jgi:hypothetical protein
MTPPSLSQPVLFGTLALDAVQQILLPQNPLPAMGNTFGPNGFSIGSSRHVSSSK